MSKCYKCGSEYMKTPVCAECGTLPIIDGELIYLNKRIEELEENIREAYRKVADMLWYIDKGNIISTEDSLYRLRDHLSSKVKPND